MFGTLHRASRMESFPVVFAWEVGETIAPSERNYFCNKLCPPFILLPHRAGTELETEGRRVGQHA